MFFNKLSVQISDNPSHCHDCPLIIPVKTSVGKRSLSSALCHSTAEILYLVLSFKKKNIIEGKDTQQRVTGWTLTL